MQIYGDALYMHQFKINGKMAFDGDVWQWHQDYGTWKNDDLMPEPRAMNVAIFLDDVNEFNGPLMFIPGSHRQGVIDAKHDTSTTSYPLWTIDNALIAELVGSGGRLAKRRAAGSSRRKGPAGSMILFHGCLVHASTSNLSPWTASRVPEPVRGRQPHPALQAPGVHRPPRLHAARAACPTTACCDATCRAAVEGRHAGERPRHLDRAAQARRLTEPGHVLHAKLQQREAAGKPIRVGLIGAGKFGSMFLAQVPRTPGVHLAAIADLSPAGAKRT